jgi:hypothetical protein
LQAWHRLAAKVSGSPSSIRLQGTEEISSPPDDLAGHFRESFADYLIDYSVAFSPSRTITNQAAPRRIATPGAIEPQGLENNFAKFGRPCGCSAAFWCLGN